MTFECTCDARWSGVDEGRYRDCGMPRCTCQPPATRHAVESAIDKSKDPNATYSDLMPGVCEYNCIRKPNGDHHDSCPANPNPPDGSF